MNRVILAVEIPLMVLALCTVGLRVYSRLSIKKKLATCDILIVCGMCCAVARTIISCMSAEDRYGFDVNGPDQHVEVAYYQHIFERRIAYIFAVAFTRWSVLAYYLRIFPPGISTLRRLCWVLLVVAFLQFVEVFVILIVFCRDIGKLWTADWMGFSGNRCFSSSPYSYSAAIGDSVLDCFIFALPIPYVWKLSKIRARQRFGLIVVFALGFLVCIVALLQIPFIKRREKSPSYFGGAINMLIAIQISLAIIAASLPDLRALVARSFPKFSPLRHRSLATAAARPANPDVEQGPLDGAHPGRAGLDGGRIFRKPDWLRSTIPASLLSTRQGNGSDEAVEIGVGAGVPKMGMLRRKSSAFLPWIKQNETVNEEPVPVERKTSSVGIGKSPPPASTPISEVPTIIEPEQPNSAHLTISPG
ncbi:hypothetical protein P154DRAFT_451337 [Amniculicola lignicola CBS 123094]|uniref:Rhodopsin domain-containing protein n=1 Tax=Amniculicola lignicola CBS 123094 TaxID=1392246 RepID=A0A6A5VVX0_9PLEO|nr:hypothetical protein P154DRAFT_451337 [Amniculicola lignicola CBS 123094]